MAPSLTRPGVPGDGAQPPPAATAVATVAGLVSQVAHVPPAQVLPGARL